MFLLYWLDMLSFPLRGYPVHSWHPQDGSGQIEWVEFQADSRLQQLIVAEVMWSFDSDDFCSMVFPSHHSLFGWLKKCYTLITVPPTLFFVSTMGFWDFYLFFIPYMMFAAKPPPPSDYVTSRTLGELVGTSLRWWRISKLRQLWSDFVERQCIAEIRWVML